MGLFLNVLSFPFLQQSFHRKTKNRLQVKETFYGDKQNFKKLFSEKKQCKSSMSPIGEFHGQGAGRPKGVSLSPLICLLNFKSNQHGALIMGLTKMTFCFFCGRKHG
jgi:hypothetical protein